MIDGFATVFMAGANFEDSAAYNLWGRAGIKWMEDRQFTSRLGYDEHPNGHLATIYYAIENNWSATKRNASKTNGFLESMRVATTGLFGTSNYLWQANKAVPDAFLRDGTRLPNNPLGLNAYSDSHDIAFLSALNPTPAHFRFLRDRGLTPDQIDRMGYCSTLYQSVMRTSLRDPTNLNRKRIVVVDRRAAEYLHRRLPGSTVEKLDTGIIETSNKPGRPKIHADNAEKSRKRRELENEKRRRMMLETMVLPVSQDHDGVARGNGPNLRIEIPIDYIPHFDTQLAYYGTIYSHKKFSQPDSYIYCAGWNEFVQSMEVHSQQRYAAKEANDLISPAIFDPDRVVYDPSGKRLRRGRGNIAYLQNIMLDFEKGELSPEQFAEMFPDLQMVITNTWGHTRAKPRFRIIVPTTRQMTADVYEALFDEIVQRMEDQGVVRNPRIGSNFRKSGLDHSKRSAASLFFLPCQAEIADESFFDVYDGPFRQPLDPKVWIETARLIAKHDFEFVTVQPQQGEYDQVRIDAAIDRWRNETLPKEGNRMLYLLGVELKTIGLSDYEIEAKLREESRYGRSPAKRLRQIPSIMTSLAKWRPKVSAE